MAQEHKESVDDGFAVANRMAKAESQEIWEKIQGSRKIQAFTQVRSVTANSSMTTSTMELTKPVR